MSATTEAFDIAVRTSAASQLSKGIPYIVYAALLIVFAYIATKVYAEWGKGRLSSGKFVKTIIRFVILIGVISYFLLRR